MSVWKFQVGPLPDSDDPRGRPRGLLPAGLGVEEQHGEPITRQTTSAGQPDQTPADDDAIGELGHKTHPSISRCCKSDLALSKTKTARRSVFGSFNWSEPSRRFNREIGIISGDEPLFEALAERWVELGQHASPAGSGAD